MSWSPRVGAPSPPAPPRVKAICRWGLPRDPLPGRVPPQGTELLRGVPALRVASPRSTCGSSSGHFRERPGDPPAWPRGARCAWMWASPALTPDTHAPRGQPARQTAAPEGLGDRCLPPLTCGQDVRVPGSLAGRVTCLTAQSRAVTCDPDTLPGAQQAGQRLPGGHGRLGRRGHQKGRQEVSVPLSQEADPALLPPGAPANSGPWSPHRGQTALGAAPRDGRTRPKTGSPS